MNQKLCAIILFITIAFGLATAYPTYGFGSIGLSRSGYGIGYSPYSSGYGGIGTLGGYGSGFGSEYGSYSSRPYASSYGGSSYGGYGGYGGLGYSY